MHPEQSLPEHILQVDEQPLQDPLGDRFEVPKHDKQSELVGPWQVRQELSHFLQEVSDKKYDGLQELQSLTEEQVTQGGLQGVQILIPNEESR